MMDNPKPYLIIKKGGVYERDVVSVDSTFSVELGPEARTGYTKNRGLTDKGVTKGSRGLGGRIHAHIILEVIHKTRIHLDYRREGAFRQDILSGLRERGIHVDNIYMSVKLADSKQNLLRYISKDTELLNQLSI